MIVAVSNGSGVNFDRGPYFVFTRTKSVFGVKRFRSLCPEMKLYQKTIREACQLSWVEVSFRLRLSQG